MPLIQLKRNNTSGWQSTNPTPKSGEVCIEEVSSGIFRVKIGDEFTPWNSLYYPFVHTVGNNSFSGIQNFNSGILRNPVFSNYAESIQNVSISNSGLSINLSSGNIFRTTLNSNITGINIQNPHPSGSCDSFTLLFDYIATGYAIIWPSNIYWNGGSGSVPSIGSGVGRSAIISLATFNGGSLYYGFLGGNNFGA